MEWLTQFVPVWQAMLSLAALIWGASIILWHERQEVRGDIDRMKDESYKVERYTNERISSVRDDINGVNLRTFDLEMQVKRLEMQVKRLETPAWKRWLRKIEA